MAARIERIYEAATHRQLPLEKNMLPLVVKAEDEDGDVVHARVRERRVEEEEGRQQLQRDANEAGLGRDARLARGLCERFEGRAWLL